MDSFVGVIWDAAKCFCGCVKKEADFVFDLENNLQLLEDKRKKLEDFKKDVGAQIEEAENDPDMKLSHQLHGWLQRVELIQQKTKDIFEVQGAREIQNKCLSKWCSKNCMSNYKLGKNVAKLLNDVDELATEGKNFGMDFTVVHKVLPRAIEMPQDEVVGLDLMFDGVWKSIEEENVGIIGLYGMGGVGKTTLLKKIYNELVKRRAEFNFVMWVVVSKEPNLNSLMDNIRKKIRIEDGIWFQCSNQEEKAATIYRVLKKRKFALLLDDIWDKLDLKLVGVPHPKETNFKSKVLFTTRLKNVCAKMQVERTFKVETLTEEEASKLFCMKVGEDTLRSDPIIPKLANEMAKKCKRLPLALIVVGSAMAGVKSVEAWQYSIKNLTSSELTASDLETKVFSILKFSYDKLDEVIKRFFLYCALYPEDWEFVVPDLIDEWMLEKFICKDMTRSVEDMRGQGESIIERLKLSCLVESVYDDIFTQRTIKMHDTIRDMALWVAHNQDMELVRGISIMESWESRKILDPSNATTLILLNNVHNEQFLEGFKCMQRLKILKLKVDKVDFLVEIGRLVSLEYLSLQVAAGIWEKELLNNLRYLTNLKFFSLLASISSNSQPLEKEYGMFPLRVLLSLQQLRVFRLFGETIKLERRNLEELECLPNIEELCIGIYGGDTLNKLMESTKLQSCIRLLTIREGQIEMPSLIETMSRMKQLQEQEFMGTDIGSGQYSSVFEPCYLAKLRRVSLYKCSVTHVTWLKYAPLLQLLTIRHCTSIEEVIKEEEEKNVDSVIFSSLITLRLYGLPRLESIHRTPLPFPSLKSIIIRDCPNLKKLPLNSNSATPKLTSIVGQYGWWNNLTWEDSTAKDIFRSKFQGHIY